MVSANNAINDTVGASISGVTNTLTVTNPSNTASSAARETITVGGGSAGDPTLNFNVSGVTNWEMGIDNSVSDNLTISQGTALGTNDVWRMDTSGRRTMPLQPCFFAWKSANTGNLTGDGTIANLICDNQILDAGSNYDPGTGIFTAPITGNYFFSANLYITGMTAAHNLAIALMNVGAYQAFGNVLNPGVAAAAGLDAVALQVSLTVPLTAGAQVIPQVQVSGGAKVVGFAGNPGGPICHFSGFLVS